MFHTRVVSVKTLDQLLLGEDLPTAGIGGYVSYVGRRSMRRQSKANERFFTRHLEVENSPSLLLIVRLRMLLYRDGSQVHVGDHAVHGTAAAVDDDVIEGDEVARLGLEEPGFFLPCDECGRVLINPGSDDWEDVALVRHGA